jgi:DNA-directed RNA polymerase specialized sigma24 family protein
MCVQSRPPSSTAADCSEFRSTTPSRAPAPTPEEILALDEVLKRFAAEEPEAARVVELRYFAGLSIDETADVLRVSRATANRHWAYAKAWLQLRTQSSRLTLRLSLALTPIPEIVIARCVTVALRPQPQKLNL